MIGRVSLSKAVITNVGAMRLRGASLELATATSNSGGMGRTLRQIGSRHCLATGDRVHLLGAIGSNRYAIKKNS